MTILRAAAMLAVVVFCGGFIPVGGCAKGCGRAGRVAAHEGDDIARLGTRGGMLAGEGAAAGRYGDDLARSGRYGDDLARTGDDLAHTGAHVGDDLAHAGDVNVSSFADELEHSGAKLTESQHEEVLDALKDVGEQVIEQLADGDDSDDDAEIRRAAKQLDARLKTTLSRDQMRKVYAELGTSKQIVDRLAREAAPGSQNVKPGGAAGKP